MVDIENMEDEDFIPENAYDFVTNDEDEVMLLIYANDTEPKNATIEINTEDRSAILYRNDEDSLLLSVIPDEVFDSLLDADTLMVCELSIEDDEEDTEIVYAYEADISL